MARPRVACNRRFALCIGPVWSIEVVAQEKMTTPRSSRPDILCLSHLRWDFVFQRPQHFLTRFAKHQRVFYVEEPDQDAT